jgi:hypothetical protein
MMGLSRFSGYSVFHVEHSSGASVWITQTFEVLVTKYTKRDIEKLEKELEL